MFRNRTSSSKRSSFSWSTSLIVLSLGIVLFSAQSTLFSNPSNQSQVDITYKYPIDQNNPEQPSGEGLSKEKGTEQSFLSDYNAEEHPFFSDNPPDNRSLWLTGGELALKLLFVLGLVYLALAGLRWLQSSRRQIADNRSAIRILETTGLAPGRTLHLVVIGEKTLLIGATDHQLSLLTELADISTPLVEETSSFDETLTNAKIRNNGTPSLEWQLVFDKLQAGIRHFRQGYQTE